MKMIHMALLCIMTSFMYSLDGPPVVSSKTRHIPSDSPFSADYGLLIPSDFAGRLVLELTLEPDAGCQILDGRVQNASPTGWHGGHSYFTATIQADFRGQHLGFFLGHYTCGGGGGTIPTWNGKAKALVCGEYTYCPASDLYPRPGYGPPVNGCTNIPDLWFEQSCNKHDVGYGTCLKSKLSTDNEFFQDMMNDCADAFPDAGSAGRTLCETTAESYARAVVLVGDQFYNDAQRAACVCCQ